MRYLAALLMLWGSCALAQRPSDAFLHLKVKENELSGTWQIALRDLPALAKVDADRNRLLSWGELLEAQPQLLSALSEALRISNADSTCPLQFDELMLNDRSDARYAQISIQAQCETSPDILRIRYNLLFDIDPSHRGILMLKADATRQTGVFAPGTREQEFDLRKPSQLSAFFAYLKAGVWHIWSGLDHVFFLLALLLPAVLVYREQRWSAQASLRPVVWNLFGLVTAFAIGHSISLNLAALQWVRVPSPLVESLIAVSVMVAALNNVRPQFFELRWIIAFAFAFGLVHGFGFDTVLGELLGSKDSKLTALLGFNIGVEIGQLAIAGVVVPLAYKFRNTAIYQSVVLHGVSLVLALIAASWLAQRSGIVAAG